MNITNKIILFENGELNEEEVIKLFEQLYITGMISQLQGFYGRTFNDLVESGLIDITSLEVLHNL